MESKLWIVEFSCGAADLVYGSPRPGNTHLMQQISSRVSVGPNVTIFNEADACDSAYVIEQGTVEVSVTREGRKMVLGRRGAGEVFGEMAIIDEQPRSATVTTLEPCQLIRVTRE